MSFISSTLYDPQITSLEERLRQTEESNRKLKQQLKQQHQSVQEHFNESKVCRELHDICIAYDSIISPK